MEDSVTRAGTRCQGECSVTLRPTPPSSLPGSGIDATVRTRSMIRVDPSSSLPPSSRPPGVAGSRQNYKNKIGENDARGSGGMSPSESRPFLRTTRPGPRPAPPTRDAWGNVTVTLLRRRPVREDRGSATEGAPSWDARRPGPDWARVWDKGTTRGQGRRGRGAHGPSHFETQ
jgi:hypothetical protein